MPWVPRRVYDLMLQAMEQAMAAGTPAASGVPIGVSGGVARETAVTTAAEAASATLRASSPLGSGAVPSLGAAPLPPAVVEACAFYAFGVPEDEASNRRRAEELSRARKSPEEIVREIRQGANVDALFI